MERKGEGFVIDNLLLTIDNCGKRNFRLEILRLRSGQVSDFKFSFQLPVSGCRLTGERREKGEGESQNG